METAMTYFDRIIQSLVREKIEFVLIGGVAVVVYGSARETRDVDVIYARSKENIRRVVRFLKKINAHLRGAPDNLPFQPDEKSILFGMNFAFATDLGAIDFLGEAAGLGGYPEAFRSSEPFDLYGVRVNVLTLEGLIKNKKAANRPKDQIDIKELEAIRELQKRK